MYEDILEKYGDVPFDQAFPSGEVTPQAATPSEAPIEEPAPQVTPDTPFLSTSTGTVYKSAEEAARGIEHKDSVIAKLRSEAIERTGVDPLTGQLVKQNVQTVQPVQSTPAPKPYSQNGEQFIKDLADAAQKGDMQRYVQVQAQLAQEAVAPLAPILNDFAKSQAVEAVGSKFSDFRTFKSSPDYEAVLSDNPALANAIRYAEANATQAPDLKDMYEIAYKLNAARRIPEVVRQPAQAVQQARPTINSTATPAHPQGGRVVEVPNMATSQGRSAIIAQQQRSGVEDIRF